MSAGHTKWFGFPLACDVQSLDNSLAAGFIISSAEDMSRYLLMHLGEGAYGDVAILTASGVTALHEPASIPDETSEYAMGLVSRAVNEITIMMHDGSTQGFNSGMAFSPEEQWGVVVLTNMSSLIELPAMGITLGVTELVRGTTPDASSRLPGMIYLAALLITFTLLALTIRSLILLLELSVPFFVFIFLPAGAGFPLWPLLALFHPDLVYGLLAISTLLIIKVLWRIYLVFKIYRTQVKGLEITIEARLKRFREKPLTIWFSREGFLKHNEELLSEALLTPGI